MALAEIGSVLSGLGALGFGKKKAKPNYKQAQNQIRWTVNDAQKAGIHPLYALGQSSGAAPVTVGGEESPLTGVGNAMGRYAQSKQNASSRASQSAQANKLTDAQVRQSDAQARLANKQADLVEQQAIDSHMNRLGQVQNHRQDNTGREPAGVTEIISPQGKTRVDPRNTDAEIVERIYGGGIGEVYGLGRYFGEIGADLGKRLWKAEQKRRRAKKPWTKRTPRSRTSPYWRP